MQVVLAPATLHQTSLFLGGSITGTDDWQKEFLKKLENVSTRESTKLSTDLIVFNPRRIDFDVNDRFAEQEQIEWEARHLRMADAVLFWFAKETLAPIVLFELGRHSMFAGRPLFVGTDPDYKRRNDVKIQMSLTHHNVPIRTNLDEMVEDVWSWVAHLEMNDYGRNLTRYDKASGLPHSL